MDSLISLKIGETKTRNSNGDIIKVPTWTNIFAEKKSIRQSEFYQAAQTDFKPEIMFEVWLHEYNGENELKYDGDVYQVLRTYSNNKDKIEIVCGKDVI